MKKRHRFMAGKALKDVNNLNKCSACGNVKRAHLLCPFCVRGMFVDWVEPTEVDTKTLTEIRDMWLGKSKPKDGADAVSS